MIDPTMADRDTSTRSRKIKSAGTARRTPTSRARPGSSTGTVAAWRAHRQVPRGTRARRLVELSALVERLAARDRAASYIPVWLNKPMPRLEHRAPADVIAAGDYEQVSGAIGELEYPTFT